MLSEFHIDIEVIRAEAQRRMSVLTTNPKYTAADKWDAYNEYTKTSLVSLLPTILLSQQLSKTMRLYYILAFAALSLFSSCQLYEDAPTGMERPGVVLDDEILPSISCWEVAHMVGEV